MRIKLMCLILAVQSCLMPYQTEVHQVITDEAFHLLKSFFPGVELSELGIQLGQIGNYGERQWQNGDVLTGAFREDLEDVVWGYGPESSFPITWLFVSSPTATPTHFWVADNGDDYETPNVGYPWGGTFPNAYQKTIKFIYGGWKLLFLESGSAYIKEYKYNSLIDLAKTGIVQQTGYYNVFPGDYVALNPPQTITLSENLRKRFVYEILGRVLHLLQDMSVPAHVHGDAHPDLSSLLFLPCFGASFCEQSDQYENALTQEFVENSWDWVDALNAGGLLLNNDYASNPIKYLFYTANQVADFFPSSFDGWPWIQYPGNNSTPKGSNSTIEEIYSSFNYQCPSNIDIYQFGNINYVLSIRTTATLLYWFAYEMDFIKTVTITSSRTEDHVQVRNPALSVYPHNSQYYWHPTPYTLQIEEEDITLDLMADVWPEPYIFINWEKRNRNNIRIGGYSGGVEWLDANATATSTFIANYAPLVTVSFDPIQIESSNANAYYKNLTTGEISSSFSFPQGYPITVEAVAPQDYLFLGWSDNNSFIGGPNPASFNPASSISGYYATFKKMNASNDLNAYANNNQRKFVKNYSGVLFSVYSSMEKVWIEYSTNNGSTWELGNEKRPLFQGLDAKNPSIEIWNDYFNSALEIQSYLLVIAQVNIDGLSDIQVSRLTWNPSHYTFREWNHIPFDEQSVFWPFPYSETNLKPVVGMIGPGRILVAVDMLELGKTIWFQAGELSYNYYINWFQDYWITSQNTLSNVSMYSTKLDIDASQGDEYVCWIAYEEIIGSSSPRIMVTKAYMTSYSGFDLTAPIILSENNGFPKNYSPSVTAWLEGEDNHCAAVIWTAFRKTAPVDAPLENPGEGSGPGGSQSLGETKVFFRSFSNGIWSQPRSYGNNINSAHINKNTNNSYAFAWSEGTNNVNRYVKSNNLTTLYTTNTVGKYLQVGNFANLNAMRLNSFQTANSPYLFQLSNTFGNTNEEEFNTDRSGVVVKDTLAFYFSLGNIKVNDQLVDFIEVPDSLTISNKETLNTYLLSEPFNLSDESNFIYSIKFGVTDSVSAANTLVDNKSVHFQVCLIDDQTGEILGTLDDVLFDDQNITQYENIAYQVNTQGIGNRTCRLKLVTEDNISFNYSVIDNRDNDTTLAKKGFIEKSFNGGEIVKTYELTQNYPNPFNPTTSIKYQIPKTSIVTLKVYDILGAEVVTLVNEEKIPGKYEVSFDATRLASGVYIYRLIAEKFISSKKMILLK